MEWALISPALSLLMKHLVIAQRQKAPNFLAFHWSPHGSLFSVGQGVVTTRVVHTCHFSLLTEIPGSIELLENSLTYEGVQCRKIIQCTRTETSLITESDRSGPNY